MMEMITTPTPTTIAPPSSARFNVANIDSGYVERIKRDYSDFLAPLCNPSIHEVSSKTIISYDYSNIISEGFSEDGPALFEAARFFDDRYSALVRAEDKLVVRVCCPDFSRMLSSFSLPFDSFGPGTFDAIMKKDIALLYALNSLAYIYNAVEMDRTIGQTAVDLVMAQMKRSGRQIVAKPYQVDFTQRWPKKLREGGARFSAMLGGTMGQLDMHEFFGHYNQMTGGQGLLFFTLNCNQENPEADYQGSIFRKFKAYTWNLLRTVSGDLKFDATSPEYLPDFVDGQVRHRYIFKNNTSVNIDGADHHLRRGIVAITGYSARPTPESVPVRAEGTGMKLIKQYSDVATHSYGFLLKGDRFPYPLVA